MSWNRLIPILLIHRGGLWKTERFRPKTYVGDPTNAVRIFNDKQVDELIVLDIDASKSGRGPNFDALERLASEAFMPLCYGGGLRSLEDAKRAFSCGVEKVAINTCLTARPALIEEIAAHAGRQATVVSMDLARQGSRLAEYSHVHGDIVSGDWAAQLEDYCQRGAGEVLVNMVDRDGTLHGPDFEAISDVAELCTVPLIAAGGVRDLVDAQAVTRVGASAVAAGAMFVYRGPYRAVLISYPEPQLVQRALQR